METEMKELPRGKNNHRMTLPRGKRGELGNREVVGQSVARKSKAGGRMKSGGFLGRVQLPCRDKVKLPGGTMARWGLWETV